MLANPDCAKFVSYSYQPKPTFFKKLFGNSSPSLTEVYQGIQAHDRQIHKFVRYNQFEKQLTPVPRQAQKNKYSRGVIDSLYCGKSQPLKADKTALTSYQNDPRYYTGSVRKEALKDFVVYVHNKKVEVFRIPDRTMITGHKLNRYHYTEKVLSLTPLKIWIGKSPKSPLTEMSRTYGKKFDGNSLLVQLEPKEYVYIGDTVYSFKTLAEIDTYISPVGANGFPQPYAVDKKKNVYLLSDGIVVTPNSMFPSLHPSSDPFALVKKYKKQIKTTRFPKKLLVKYPLLF